MNQDQYSKEYDFLNNKIIVAIDDTISILSFLEISLENEGADFYSATTAAKGLELLKNKKPDLVVLDLGLPDKDGLEILPLVKQEGNTKVIILTARRETCYREQANKSGADAYLTKPFVMDDLLETIEDVLAK